MSKAYPKYKPSGVEWLGDVPEHWEVKKLSWLFSYSKGPNAAQLTKDYIGQNTGDYPVYSGQTENDGLMGEIDSYDFNFQYPVIFVTTVGAKAMSTRLVQGKFSLSQNCALVIPRNAKVDSRYFEGVLRPLFDYEKRSISLIMQPSLRFEDLNRFRVPLPPLPEQQAIAAFLDRETGRIDALIAKKERLLELLAEQRTALISRAVTKGLDASVKLKPSGVEWLGDVPEHWEALPLRRIVEKVKTGGTPTGAEDSAFDDEGFNWYSPGDFSDDIRLGKSSRSLSDEGKQEVRIFPPKTVMLVGIGTIGKVGLAINESSCNQQINGIICSRLLNPEFATYYMKTLKEYIIKCGKYTTLPIINQDETKNLIFTLPPLPEQQAIAAFLDRETAKIDALSSKVATVIERLKEYRTALISSAVTGKIDVREAV